MKEEEKDKEIEELEREIEELELKYRKFLYGRAIYIYIASALVSLIVVIVFILGMVLDWFKDEDLLKLFLFVFITDILITIIAFVPPAIYIVILFLRLNELYTQLAEKKGGVITGFIGGSPVFLRWLRRKKRDKKF